MRRTPADPAQSLLDADRREALEYLVLAVLLAGLALAAFLMSLHATLANVDPCIAAALIAMFACFHCAGKARAHSKLPAPQRKRIEEERMTRIEEQTGAGAPLKPSWAKRMQNS